MTPDTLLDTANKAITSAGILPPSEVLILANYVKSHRQLLHHVYEKLYPNTQDRPVENLSPNTRDYND